MSKFICDLNTYKLGGPKEDAIGLPVSLSGLPDRISVEGYELLLKDEFHVTLVCIGKIIVENKFENSNFVNDVVTDFCEFTKNTPIKLSAYKNEFKFAKEKERRSVVVMCDVTNLNYFFDHLNKKHGLSLEYPPTHVTIYTLQPNLGIFLADSSDLENLTRPIPNPVGFNL